MSLILLWRGGGHERRLSGWRIWRSCGATITDGLMELDRDFSDFSEFIASCTVR